MSDPIRAAAEQLLQRLDENRPDLIREAQCDVRAALAAQSPAHLPPRMPNEEEVEKIAGQKAVVTHARTSIAGFKVRENMPIGTKVTLRKERMYEFLDRLINIALPRVRDFRGLNPKSFDGRGNFAMGIKEHIVFPEINYDMVEQIHGMDLTFVTTATKDAHAFALLHQLGMPFRGDEKPVTPRVAQPGAAA